MNCCLVRVELYLLLCCSQCLPSHLFTSVPSFQVAGEKILNILLSGLRFTERKLHTNNSHDPQCFTDFTGFKTQQYYPSSWAEACRVHYILGSISGVSGTFTLSVRWTSWVNIVLKHICKLNLWFRWCGIQHGFSTDRHTSAGLNPARDCDGNKEPTAGTLPHWVWSQVAKWTVVYPCHRILTDTCTNLIYLY